LARWRESDRETDFERDHDRLKKTIEAEKSAIAAGSLLPAEFSVGHSDSPVSRREKLLDLQSCLAAVESKIALEELNV
jgi:hypothetical protein